MNVSQHAHHSQDFILKKSNHSYPNFLREISDPPEHLHCRGLPPDKNETFFAIVGTRHPSPYGKEMAYTFSRDVSMAGFVIVSGLAYGIDAIAHEAALDAGGKTVAVLGSGLDYITPPSNKPLAARIQKNGCLLSEFPHDLAPNKGTFPQRNRIIAGMSIGTLVIEAPLKSGALITARLAFESNRPVFALPGQITSETSRGTHRLIQNSMAHLVTCAADILEELGMTDDPSNRRAQFGPNQLPLLTPDESHIYSIIEKRPASLHELSEATNFTSARMSSALSLLELKRLIKVQGGYVAAITR